MVNFLSEYEKKISNEFHKKGYIIKKINDSKSLNKIKNIFLKSIIKNTKISKKEKAAFDLFNFIHKKIPSNKLNNFRLKIIKDINNQKDIRELYYKISKDYLDILVGNELSMQRKINLSIQMPKDKSSLLPLHSDVWSGDSPYETVVWLPLVDCYKSKAMYILPPKEYIKLLENLNTINLSLLKRYIKIKNKLKWIDIKFGNVLIFNQCLPHGNVVNREKETRWSLNCRFKSIFSPHKDKKIGEFLNL